MKTYSFFKNFINSGLFAFIILFISLLIQLTGFWSSLFLPETFNGDESEYYYFIESAKTFSDVFYSGSIPFLLPSYFFDILFNVQYPTRFISFILGILLLFYIFFRFKNVFGGFELLFYTTVFFFVVISLRQLFIGTSDFMATAFCLVGFIELNRCRFINKPLAESIKTLVLIGFVFSAAFMARPPSIICVIFFLISFLLLNLNKFHFNVFSILFFIIFLFVILFSIPNLIRDKEVKLDLKTIPEKDGTNWNEMNYLMALHWDDGSLPREIWYSSHDVSVFKRENPNFHFPANQFELVYDNAGLVFRTIIRELFRGLYSVFLHSSGLIFILIYILYNNFNKSFFGFQETELIISFISIGLLIILFSFISIKMFEFRWIHSVYLFFIYKSILYCEKHFIKKSSLYNCISIHCFLFSIYTWYRLFS